MDAAESLNAIRLSTRVLDTDFGAENVERIGVI
jgi:hypothetical protein